MLSAYFCSTNRNKRSLTLNIQSAPGQAVMHRLLTAADVFMCNIPRADSLRRAALDVETIRAKFPRLIYASITGYGRTGPYAAIGILAALRVRDQTGQGQLLDLSLLESQAAYLTILAGDFFATGQAPRPLGNAHPA